MKRSKLIIAVFTLFTPFFLSAQSVVGDWLMDAVAPDGSLVKNKLSIKDNGIMEIDFGNDGTVNVVTSYTVDGDKISLKDTSEDSPCYNVVGVYQFKIKGNTNTVRLVDDPCEARRGEGTEMLMTRIE